MTASITRRGIVLTTVVGGMLVGALAAGTASADTTDDSSSFDTTPDAVAASAISAVDRAGAELPECDFASIHLQNETEDPSWEVEMVCTDGDISQYVEVDAETSEVISINDDYTAGDYDDGADDGTDDGTDASADDDYTGDDANDYDDYTGTDTDSETETKA